MPATHTTNRARGAPRSQLETRGKATAAGDSTIARSEFFTVLRLDDSVLARLFEFHELAVSVARRSLELERHRVALLRTLDEALTPFFTLSGPATITGISIHAPGQLTVTRRTPGSKKLGLHLDSWDREPLPRRSVSRNRISVNLGEQARVLCFGDVLASSLETLPAPGADLGRALASHPAQRFYAVTIEPGCAYIAPTENIAHDASTLAQTAEDVSFTVIANIDVR